MQLALTVDENNILKTIKEMDLTTVEFDPSVINANDQTLETFIIGCNFDPILELLDMKDRHIIPLTFLNETIVTDIINYETTRETLFNKALADKEIIELTNIYDKVLNIVRPIATLALHIMSSSQDLFTEKGFVSGEMRKDVFVQEYSVMHDYNIADTSFSIGGMYFKFTGYGETYSHLTARVIDKKYEEDVVTKTFIDTVFPDKLSFLENMYSSRSS